MLFWHSIIYMTEETDHLSTFTITAIEKQKGNKIGLVIQMFKDLRASQYAQLLSTDKQFP